MSTSLDNLIHQWQEYLTNISSNLMELSDQTGYKLIKLKASGAPNGYTGITKAKAEKCVEKIGALWRYFALLSGVVEKAVDLNKKQSLLYNPENDVKELLEKSLIVIDEEHVDINKRDLIEDETDEKKASPKELLKYMQESFQEVCRDISEISTAEETIQKRLSSIKNEILKLNSTASRLGITNIPAFDPGMAAAIENDPLRGQQELDKLVYSIEKYRSSIRTIEEEYNMIVGSFNGIRGMLSELGELNAKSKTAVIESRKVFGDTVISKPVISDEVLESLKDWLRVLESKLSEGSLKAVKVGASNLEKECSAKLQAERDNYNFNSRVYNEWLDLKGEFKALLAKADVLRMRVLLIDGSLDELIEKTDAALHSNPVNMESCRQLVKRMRLSL
jgi:prefoldin subunit 5